MWLNQQSINSHVVIIIILKSLYCKPFCMLQVVSFGHVTVCSHKHLYFAFLFQTNSSLLFTMIGAELEMCDKNCAKKLPGSDIDQAGGKLKTF